jgi:TPR repeat protein
MEKSKNYETAMKYIKQGDFSAAIPYLEKAAEQGDREAQLELSDIYYFGKGMIKDPEKAKYWFEKWFEKISPPSRFNICTSCGEDKRDRYGPRCYSCFRG